MTPLHWAVHHENLKLVELLLEAGANRNVVSVFQKTSLSIAVEKNNHDIIQMLTREPGSETDIKYPDEDICFEKSDTTDVDAQNLIKENSHDIIEMPKMDDTSSVATFASIEEMEHVQVPKKEYLEMQMMKKHFDFMQRQFIKWGPKMEESKDGYRNSIEPDLNP